MKTILITGGTGLIGRQLTSRLATEGYHVTWLTRKVNSMDGIQQFHWDWKKGEIDPEAIEQADAIIHLAGAAIDGKRWSKKWKKEIRDSRIRATEFLFEALSNRANKVKTIVASSAVGYYGAVTSEKIFSEADLHSSDFLGNTCYEWEQESNKFSELGIRTVIIRTGIVLSKNSRALKKIVLPVRLGLGAAIGTGKQNFPWIHNDDICGIYMKALDDKTMQGTYNAVAPEFISNKYLMKTIARLLHKPFWLPDIPPLLIKLLYGELSVSLLNGSKISSEKIKSAGYKFKYETLTSALADLLNK